MIERRSLRLLAAALAGLSTALAFPGAGFAVGTFLGPAILLALLRDRRPLEGALLGGIAGLVHFGIVLSWLGAFGLVAVVPLVVVLSAWHALFGALAGAGRWGRRARGGSVEVALLWAGLEVLRSSWPLGGFDWGALGYAAGDGVAAFAPFGGVHLVSAWLVLEAAVILQLSRCRTRPVVAGIVATLLAPTAVAMLPDGTSATRNPIEIAVVQGSVPEDAFIGLPRRGRIGPEDPIIVENHLRVTDQLVGLPAPDLVIWPENAFDRDPRSTPELLAATTERVDALEAPFLVGAIVDVDGGAQQNANVLLEPGRGFVTAIPKQHLVPFGEYVPWPWVRRLVPVVREFLPTDLEPGEGSGVFAAGGVRIGSVICFESTYGRDVRRVIRGGAEVLVVSTNNASYGRSAASAQHLQMSRMRALEFRRPVVQAAISGISAFITPTGAVRDASGHFVPTLLRRDVTPVTGQTWFARFGDLSSALILVLGGALSASAVWRRRRT